MNFIFPNVPSPCGPETTFSTCSQSDRACLTRPCGTPRRRSVAKRSPKCCTASRWSRKSTLRCSLAKILPPSLLMALKMLHQYDANEWRYSSLSVSR
ncbi:unnamed protein product [Arctia plantaginis]|uniref:Uncharacterized protein n=1 Tax=Arctia plantaginis TaxID=874455 RepID=A0A8S0ZK25_ARCPL|nr:unnamed protein product [Arctia plantaginis]CAB3238250.1 unnamed protein product [Arctia plantaginis]